jgi:hypothetical protein
MKELTVESSGAIGKPVRGSVWARFHHWCLKRKVIVFFQYVVP